jgi:hypothetical protein
MKGGKQKTDDRRRKTEDRGQTVRRWEDEKIRR